MATWYISPTGNDTTGTGTSALPWLTISKAHTSAASGDTIICKTSATAYTWSNQTFTKTLTIQGESAPTYVNGAWITAIFDGSAASVQWIINSPQTLTCRNLILRNATNPSNTSPLFISNVTGTSSAVLTFTHCIFTQLVLISTTRRAGFVGDNPPGTVNVNTCIFYGNTCPAGDTIFNTYNDTGIINFTNTIVHGATSLFGKYDGTLTASAQNCIFSAASSYALSSASFGSITWTFNNNLTYNYTGIPTGTGNLSGDPLFVAPTSGDFRLRPGSPAANTGVAL